jgi:hypothetical protein
MIDDGNSAVHHLALTNILPKDFRKHISSIIHKRGAETFRLKKRLHTYLISSGANEMKHVLGGFLSKQSRKP